MPRVAKGEDGVLTFKIHVRATEHPALFRALIGIDSGAKRRTRLFALAYMGLALDSRACQGVDPAAPAPTPSHDAGASEDLPASDLEDWFRQTSTDPVAPGA